MFAVGNAIANGDFYRTINSCAYPYRNTHTHSYKHINTSSNLGTD